MTIGERLRRARKRLGKTQIQIAVELGKTQATVSGWESDDVLPELRALRQVAEAYGIRPEALIPPGPVS